ALYQPSLLKARFRKFVAYYLARLGLPMLWTPWIMCVSYKKRPSVPKGLHAILGNCFGADFELALFTGTPGYLRKPTIQIMDASGSILGYCKMAENSQTRVVVENEANAIKLLTGLDLGDTIVPNIIFSGETSDGIAVLIESTQKKHLSSAPLSPETIHSDFLVRLFEETKTELRFREAPVYQEIMDRISGLDGYAEEGLLLDIVDALEWSSAVVDSAKIPLCFAHRDFTPWNTFLAEEHLYVFDWEFGRRNWAPLCDAFHFVLQKGILVDRAGEDVLWERLSGHESKEGRFLKKCATLTGIGENVYPALLAFYFIDMITTYLFHYKGHGHTPIDGQELLGRWKGLLNRVMGKKMNLTL
nr:hypothetical protein [Syntrophorhabdaceae bacterium]